jgi:hypothetical protein
MVGQIRISEALGRIASKTTSAPDAVAILIKGLDSADVWVRLGAAKALGSFGEDAVGAIPRLRMLSHDSVKELRDVAQRRWRRSKRRQSAPQPPDHERPDAHVGPTGAVELGTSFGSNGSWIGAP